MKLFSKIFVLATLLVSLTCLAATVTPVVPRPQIPQVRNNIQDPAYQWYNYALYLEKMIQANGNTNAAPSTDVSGQLATILSKVNVIESYVTTYRVLVNLPFRSITLNWVDNSNNETGFLVESSINGVDFVKAVTVGPNITTYKFQNLGPGTYFYRVSALAGNNATTPTTIVSATLN
jgi:hypothetical protein